MLYRRQLELSRRDHLTGLLNRRAFVEFIGMEGKRMARHHRPMTIAYIDLDNFKHVNDEHGHSERPVDRWVRVPIAAN